MKDQPLDPEPAGAESPDACGRAPESQLPGAVPPDTPGRTRDSDVWDALARWRVARRPFVLASVVGTRGFTPRKAAAHMLIASDGDTVGTIGGGAIEREVIEHALRLFEGGGNEVLSRRTRRGTRATPTCGIHSRAGWRRAGPSCSPPWSGPGGSRHGRPRHTC